jgi:hypothetical protein
VKKLLLLSVFLVGCNGNSCKTNEEFSEMRYVPEGAKFIKSYTPKSSSDRWMKLELDGECFLSYDIGGERGLLTKVNCLEGEE